MTLAFNAAANFNRANEIFMPANMPMGMGFRRMAPVSGFGRINGNIPYDKNGEINFTKLSADQVVMKASAEDLADAIVNNNSSIILKRWDAFKQAFKNTAEYKRLEEAFKGGEINEKYINEMVANKFEQLTGQSIRNLVRENAHGNLVSGFINGLTFGLAGDKSSSKLQDKMLHSKETTGSKIVRTTGNVAGGAAAGAAIGAGIGVWFGGVGAGPGAAIGAGIGAVCGLISKLWS